VAIIDARSMAHAAESLHVAPTALSLQVKAMEDHFQTPLMRRHSRGVVATDTGSQLYSRAQQVLNLVEDLERDLIPKPAKIIQMVRLGVPPAIARTIGVEAFVGAGKRMEGVSLQVADGWTGELLDKLDRGDLDFVMGYAIPPTDERRVVEVVEDRFIYAVAPDRAGDGGRISLEEALQSDLVFYGEKSIGWGAWLGATERAGLRFENERHVESIDIWRKLLCRGLGTTITTIRAIADEYQRGELVIREIDGPPILRRIGVAYRAETEAKAWAGDVVDFLTETLLSVQSRVGAFSRVLSILGVYVGLTIDPGELGFI